VKKTQVYEWHKRFRDDHASVSDSLCCEKLSTLTNDDTQHVQSDCQKGIQEISAESEISVGSFQ
jgi:hypothetical protein